MSVKKFLKSHSVAFEVIVHRPTFDAQRMAQAVDVPGREVAKTVLLRADDTYVVAVLPATRRIDLVKAGQVLGTDHVELATEIEIEQHCPDCDIGALPPFGSQYDMKTLVEESLTADKEIVFEGNTHDEAIRMTYDDFERIEQPLVASFATGL